MVKNKLKSDPHAEREASKYDNPIPSREFILEHLSEMGKPATYEQLLDDFGLAILETGQQEDGFTNKAAASLRYGAAHTHGHNDGLDLAVWGKGMRAITDLAAREGSPSPRLQKMHNTVEVDRKSMNNEDETIPGYGWLNAFAPATGVQYADASQRARSHPQLTEYRRVLQP